MAHRYNHTVGSREGFILSRMTLMQSLYHYIQY